MDTHGLIAGLKYLDLLFWFSFAADEAGLLFRVSEQSYLDVADVSMVFLLSRSSSQPERGLEGGRGMQEGIY